MFSNFTSVLKSSSLKFSFSPSVLATLEDNSSTIFLSSFNSKDNECSLKSLRIKTYECIPRATRIAPSKMLIHRRDLLCWRDSCRSSIIAFRISLKMTRGVCCFWLIYLKEAEEFHWITIRAPIALPHTTLDTWPMFITLSFLSHGFMRAADSILTSIFTERLRFLRSLELPKYYYAKWLNVYLWLSYQR